MTGAENRKEFFEMNSEPFFSVVIYMSNEYVQTTLYSIFAQENIEQDDIQIVLAKSTDADNGEYLSDVQGERENVCILSGTFDTQAKAYDSAKKQLKGKFVCFSECGGSYTLETFANVREFLENSGIKLAAIMSTGSGNQNAAEINKGFKNKPQICDLNDKYNLPFIFLSNCFISRELTLDINTKLAVRTVFECDLMMKSALRTQIIGLFKNKNARFEPCAADSPIYSFFEELRNSETDLKAFFDEFVTANFERCIKEYGCLPKFVQYNIMMFLRWSFTAPSAEVIFAPAMTVEEYEEYLKKLLQYVDDNVINNCGLLLAHKLLIFRLKYSGRKRFVRSPFAKKMYFDNTKVCEMSTNPTNIEFVRLEENKVVLQGRIKYVGCERENFSVYALVNGTEKIEAKDRGHKYDTLVWGRNEYPGVTFEIEIDLSGMDECVIELFSVNDGDVVKRKGIRFGKFSPLASNVPDCYYYNDRRIMTYSEKNSAVVIRKASKFDKFKSELRYLKTLSKIDDDYARNAYLARMVYHVIKPFYKKQIWLISDRTNRGDDNGEAFFKYMQTVKNKNIKCYFVIDKNSEEGKRISKIGKTINTNSKKHKIYHLLSSYIISSQANNPVVNPLLSGNIYYRDILSNMRFAFLQHGVIKDDLSGWLNVYNRNMFGFVVTTNQEYQSILDYDYFYEPENVWLTGLPRHDLLYHDEKKYITIMPTWRKSLMTHPDPLTGIWLIRDDFKESKYYQFYNSLLNNERLRKTAREYGYKLCLKPHPIIDPYVDMFDKNDDVIFFDEEKTYREIFAETNLMLTDYSSVAFDFAYLRKPILYTQFDKEAFFSGEHSYTAGYYDYDRDGFGEVTYDLESTVDCIIDYIKNDCKIKDKYLERINNTFAFSDKNCSERVYQKLLAENKK